MSIPSRIKSAYTRLGWCTRFTHNPLTSVVYFVQYKFDRRKVVRGRYGAFPFVFRGGDLDAIKEVLIDGEYTVLSDFIKTRENPVILDLGHHIGTFALWCFSQNKSTILFGVEAGADTHAIAAQNVALGKEAGLNWRLINRAAWRDDSMISFAVDGHSLGHRVKPDGQAKVQGIDFPALLQAVGGRCDLMKIDIEGAEEAFLLAHPACLEVVDALIIEIHPQHCSEEKVRKLLAENFSTIRNVQKRPGGKPILWCEK